MKFIVKDSNIFWTRWSKIVQFQKQFVKDAWTFTGMNVQLIVVAE